MNDTKQMLRHVALSIRGHDPTLEYVILVFTAERVMVETNLQSHEAVSARCTEVARLKAVDVERTKVAQS